MKKLAGLILVFALALALAGCGDAASNKAATSSSSTVQGVLDQKVNGTETASKTSSQTAASKNAPGAPAAKVDVDLTKLSSTMVYSEVYNMMYNPMDYVGKTVRMKGDFAVYQAYDEEGNQVPGLIYYACVIQDATSCCAQGMEFVLAKEAAYPDDYPAEGTLIDVTGTFGIYYENGYMFCHLVDSDMQLV